ncbi:MAG TPA: EscN/YscN/HrcN family type III secretion system ATPase, partial [Pirellulales bacterium]|nr:EscN/YscN/HrcN family type III secretion system ATPase [Pirellulales bacterium]
MSSELIEQLPSILPSGIEGSVVRMVGVTAAVADFPAPVGALVEIEREGGASLEAEVIGFTSELTLVYPYSDMQGVRHGNRVRLKRSKNWIRVGPELLGRVVDARGHCIDGRAQPWLPVRRPLDARPPAPMNRPRIDTPISTGIRVIDGLLTCGKGQRMGIFAGSGVGKSVTLGMMARYTTADVNVIALVGERGREVVDFLEESLGETGRQRSVV